MVRGGRRGPWLPDHLVQPLIFPYPYLLDVCPLPSSSTFSSGFLHPFLVCCFLCQPLFHLFILCHFILNDNPYEVSDAHSPILQLWKLRFAQVTLSWSMEPGSNSTAFLTPLCAVLCTYVASNQNFCFLPTGPPLSPLRSSVNTLQPVFIHQPPFMKLLSVESHTVLKHGKEITLHPLVALSW